MPRKKEINLDELNFKHLLEESVECSRVGRTIASFGATLTGREKHDRELVYTLLRAGRELPSSLATAKIDKEVQAKKITPSEAIKWFSDKYPNEAEPLLAKLQERYEKSETLLVYGLKGRDLSDESYVKVLVDILGIPQQDAAVLYHGVIKPQIERISEEEGLVKVVMK